MGRARNTSVAASTGAFDALLGARRGVPSAVRLSTPPAQLDDHDIAVLCADPDLGLRYLRTHANARIALMKLTQAMMSPHADHACQAQAGVLRGLQHALRVDEPTSNTLAVYADTSHAPVCHQRRPAPSLRTVCGQEWASSNQYYLPVVGHARKTFAGLRLCETCALTHGDELCAELRRRPMTRAARTVAAETRARAAFTLAMDPPATAEELPAMAAQAWADAAVKVLAAHLRRHPDSAQRALAEHGHGFTVPELAHKQMRDLGQDWWQELVAKHLRTWDDYAISTDPEEALRNVRSPWGRQSRGDFRASLHNALVEQGVLVHTVRGD